MEFVNFNFLTASTCLTLQQNRLTSIQDLSYPAPRSCPTTVILCSLLLSHHCHTVLLAPVPPLWYPASCSYSTTVIPCSLLLSHHCPECNNLICLRQWLPSTKLFEICSVFLQSKRNTDGTGQKPWQTRQKYDASDEHVEACGGPVLFYVRHKKYPNR